MAPVVAPDLEAPWQTDTLLQLRTSKMQPMHNLSITTGIYKQPRSTRVYCSRTGFVDDEHDLTFHGGIDKAVHQYYPGHYASWRAEFPGGQNFEVGGFGENLVSERMNERNVCIGDRIRVGEALLEVSLPRQPCFKLNHRFSLKAFASQTWKKSRTGWYYRVLEEGWVEVGDRFELVSRKYPQWTIERVQEYLHRDTKNLKKLLELQNISEFGNECKRAFNNLIADCRAEEEKKLNGVKKKDPEVWEEFELIEKKVQTPRIASFTFRKVGDEGKGDDLDPGSFVRLKLPNGMVRPYSIVDGHTRKLELGIALDDSSRGGSRYLHYDLKRGDRLLLSRIVPSVPIRGQASNHIFIAGGVGITAFLHHMNIYDQINYNYTLHYAVRSTEDIAFKDILEQKRSNGQVIIYDKSKGQRMDVSAILRDRVWNTAVYTCGPQRLLDAVVRTANQLGMASDEIHYEAFQTTTSGDPFSVELKQDGRVLEVGEQQTLLQVLKESGIEIESSCEVGNCGTCRVEVCSGKLLHKGSGLAEEEKGEAMLSCVSRGVGRLVIDL